MITSNSSSMIGRGDFPLCELNGLLVAMSMVYKHLHTIAHVSNCGSDADAEVVDVSDGMHGGRGCLWS